MEETKDQVIERLHYIIRANRERHANEKHELIKELKKVQDELADLKIHSFKTKSGRYSIDYVMYCIIAKIRLGEQYDALQTNFYAVCRELNKYKAITRNFTVSNPQEVVSGTEKVVK